MKRIKFRLWSWIFLSSVLFFVSIQQPFGIFGDGLEYIVQTQSFVFDHSISIDTTKRAEYWNLTNPFQSSLTAPVAPDFTSTKFRIRERSQAGGGFGSLYPAKDGKFYYIHSWMYSLAVSPIYFVLHFASQLKALPAHVEYFSFQLFNSLLLAGAFCISIQSFYGLGLILLLILTPLSGYLSWTTPEVFQFSLLSVAFSRAKINRVFSPLLVGIAAAQNFPALIFFLPLLLLQLEKLHLQQLVKHLPVYTFAAIVGLSPWLVYQLNFGTPNLIVGVGQASLSNCSFPRLRSFIFSPIAGVLWFYPTLILFLPSLLTKRAEIVGRVTLVIFTLLLCFTMTGMVNFHSQQIGSARYTTWIFAPVAGLLLSANLSHSVSFKLLSTFGTAGVLLISYFYHNWLFAAGTHSRTNYLSILPTQAAKLFRLYAFDEEPEVLVEVVRQQELVSPWEFDSRYEIPIGENVALCLVSLRSVKNGRTKFIPSESICSSLEIPKADSPVWRRSSVLGGYYLEKVSKL